MSGCPFINSSAASPTSSDATNAGSSSSSSSAPAASCHYSDYLALGTVLSAQNGAAPAKPGGQGMMHHEENLFVLVHQGFELWFKMVLVDLDKCRELLAGIAAQIAAGQSSSSSSASAAATTTTATAAATAPSTTGVINGKLLECHKHLRRMEQIILHATNAFAILETMHCVDFLEFRDFLQPASGFQSVQFRKLEKELGVQDESRGKVNDADVFSFLRTEEQETLAAVDTSQSISNIVTRILASVAVPCDFVETFVQCAGRAKGDAADPKARKSIEAYCGNLRTILGDPVGWCEGIVLKTDEEREQFRKSVVACLYIYQYRQEPDCAGIAAVIEQLVAIEESLLMWLSRHMHMAERTIGRRSGTANTSGVGYLNFTRGYRIFHALWLVRTLTIRSSALPPLACGESLFSSL